MSPDGETHHQNDHVPTGRIRHLIIPDADSVNYLVFANVRERFQCRGVVQMEGVRTSATSVPISCTSHGSS
jgi:hypothetical protein